MEFRLTYFGDVGAESTDRRRGGNANQKQLIRKSFHRQLQRLWDELPGLKEGGWGRTIIWDSNGPEGAPHSLANLRTRFQYHGYEFVPLVTEELHLLCSLDVLFLRREGPGRAINGGDIDNRLKTLFDALTMPSDKLQLGDCTTPAEDETPFFVLLHDDKMVSRVVVEAEKLWEPITAEMGPSYAKVIINVKLKPYINSPFNLHFA